MTSEPSPAVLAETVAWVAISRLQRAYADVVNRRAWAELRELFTPDCPIRVDTVTNPPFDFTGPDEIGAFIGGAIEQFDFFEFVILNSHIEIDSTCTTASARVFMCELRQDAATGSASEAFGLYRDTYRCIEGRWWFAARSYRSMRRTGRAPVFGLPEGL